MTKKQLAIIVLSALLLGGFWGWVKFYSLKVQYQQLQIQNQQVHDQNKVLLNKLMEMSVYE